MKLFDLTLLYLIVGTACAVALYLRDPGRGRASIMNALAAVPLWPLWAPIAWAAHDQPTSNPPRAEDRLTQLRAALDEVNACIARTPLEHVLNHDVTDTILSEAERVSARNAELVRLLEREEFDLGKAQAELESLERQNASARSLASARLHLENLRRLHQLATRDERALEELMSLVAALRTELIVVVLSGSSSAGIDGIVKELWTHIEGLRRSTHGESTPA